MKALVTGGVGFIGSNLTDKLVALGYKVCVLDDCSTGKSERINPQATLVVADMRKCFEGMITKEYGSLDFDIIFHLGAQARIQPSFDYPIETATANVIGTMNILEFAKDVGAKFVYAGSSSFYGDPHKNPYAMTKWIGEEMGLMYNQIWNVPVAIARFFNVYGPRQPTVGQYATVIGIFERQYAAGETLTITGNGEQRRDFTHVSDIVDGLIAMSQDSWNGEVFNLGCGVNFSINEVAKMFRTNTKYIPARSGEAWETLADISFTQEKLKWIPKYSLTDYIQSIV